jgi:hypothetical protein
MRNHLKNTKKLILLELNEINFDLVRKYIYDSPGKYGAFETLFLGCQIYTYSESKYEYLEPWIQWPSVHTGLEFEKHKIYRLGDVVYSEVPQFFEILENHGVRVGAISAMNAENRLNNPAYFIPDPWTMTSSDSSKFNNLFTETIRQVVNDNSQSKFTFKSLLILIYSITKYAKIQHYRIYLSLVMRSIKARWNRALFLDLLLHDIHLKLFFSKKAQFSVIFLNAGAHIQHHYYFNSKFVKKQCNTSNPKWYIDEAKDPIAEMLGVYDKIVGEYLSLNEVELIVATGLSQKPYDRIKFYYRLKNHQKFFEKVGVRFRQVQSLMTRDLLIEFDNNIDTEIAIKQLRNIYIYDKNFPLFGNFDNRGTSLFITLTYPYEILDEDVVTVGSSSFRIKPYISFVAIKNGMHQDKGFAFFSKGVSNFAPKNNSHVRMLFRSVLNYFSI